MNNPVMGSLQPRLTPAIKGLIICFVIVHVLQMSFGHFAGTSLIPWLGFSPVGFLSGRVWTVATYIFLHGDFFHLLFNCLGIYMLGSELERRWGTKRFLIFFLVCGLGAAIVHTICWFAALFFWPTFAANLGSIPTIGASGSLFGLLFAFALFFGEMYMLVFLVVPMKAKHFAALMAGIELYLTVFNQGMAGGGAAHLFHLGGLLTGFIYLRLRGKNLDGRGGGFFGGKKKMGRDEVKRRLSLIVNNEEPKKGDKNFPITWN